MTLKFRSLRPKRVGIFWVSGENPRGFRFQLAPKIFQWIAQLQKKGIRCQKKMGWNKSNPYYQSLWDLYPSSMPVANLRVVSLALGFPTFPQQTCPWRLVKRLASTWGSTHGTKPWRCGGVPSVARRWLVGWLVGRSVGRSVGWLVGWLVGWFVGSLVRWFVGCDSWFLDGGTGLEENHFQ